MISHSPHPWTGGPTDDNYIWDANGRMVAMVRGWGHLQKLGYEEGVAAQMENKRVLAAAPELLEELEALVKSIDDKLHLPCSKVNTGPALELIAKVKGNE